VEEYLILGACNPRSRTGHSPPDRKIGLLPCKVLIRARRPQRHRGGAGSAAIADLSHDEIARSSFCDVCPARLRGTVRSIIGRDSGLLRSPGGNPLSPACLARAAPGPTRGSARSEAPRGILPARLCRSAAPTGCTRAQASRAIKQRIVRVAKQRTSAGSSVADAWAGSRYTPASVSTVVVSPGRGKRQVGIQGWEHGAVRAYRLPAQPQLGTVSRFPPGSRPYPGQPAHSCRGPCVLCQVGDPLTVGTFGRTHQHAIAGKAVQPGTRGIKADVQQYVIGN
jgi:hypothetical protein